jgi:farnesyl diphosphate synthase
MSNLTDWDDWVREVCGNVENFLERHLPDPQVRPHRLHQAMRYAVLGGGKRIRPLLVHAAGQLTEAPTGALTVVAASIEIIHAYSLVHDDLPAMDDDVLRRGKPTCHVQFGEATALLTGDALQALAFQWMSEFPIASDPRRQLEMIHQLAQASGSRGMAGGQAIDLESVNQEISLSELEAMHLKKTGALIRSSILLGAECGVPLEATSRRHLLHLANSLGLAFQVVDDVLDAEMDTATLGKTAGKDAASNKPTYVSIMGVSQARDFANDLQEEAMKALDALGPRTERLRALTHYIINRRS